jgi:VanZ family protein
VRDPDRVSNRNFALITAAVVVVIVYGSLYPFRFSANLDPRGPVRALLDTWHATTGRADFAANVLLYFPLGLFAVQAMRRLPVLGRVALAICAGVMLSVSMELLQFYDQDRISALVDVYSNTIGVALGAAAGAVLFRRAFRWRMETVNRPFVVILLACWLGYRLFPYVPVVDVHKYWTAIKPLVHSPVTPPVDVYRHAATWLVVAVLVEALFGTARSRLLPVLIIIILGARIMIVDVVLSPAEVAGGAIAALIWPTFLFRVRSRAAIIAACFAGAIVIEALQPFHFSTMARQFGWIPLRSFMAGSIGADVSAFLEKAFMYGALVWLMVRAGTRFAVAMAIGSILVLCLRLAQVFLPGRSAEITDPIMVLLVGVVMKLMGEDPTRVSAG